MEYWYRLILAEWHWSCFLNTGEWWGIWFFSVVQSTCLKKKKKSEAQPHDLELQTLKCTRVPELLADPKFWPSKSSSFCDVEILVGLRWNAWKTPIPNEKYKGLHEGIGLEQLWPVKLGLKSWLMLPHTQKRPSCLFQAFLVLFQFSNFSSLTTSFLSADNQNQRLPDTNLMKENSYKREMEDGEGRIQGNFISVKCLCI